MNWFLYDRDLHQELRCSSPIILQKSVLTCCKEELAFFVLVFLFYLGFLSHDYSRFTGPQGKWGPSVHILSTTSNPFTDTKTLAALLLQRSHLCTQVAAGFEAGTFWFPNSSHQRLSYAPFKTHFFYRCNGSCCQENA